MASGNAHLLVGGVVGFGLYVVNKKIIYKGDITFEGALASFAIGTIAGILPDLIEPACNPNHRQFFHSLALVIILLYLRGRLIGLDQRLKRYLDCFLGAYGSHLICDLQTPKGLPFI